MLRLLGSLGIVGVVLASADTPAGDGRVDVRLPSDAEIERITAQLPGILEEVDAQLNRPEFLDTLTELQRRAAEVEDTPAQDLPFVELHRKVDTPTYEYERLMQAGTDAHAKPSADAQQGGLYVFVSLGMPAHELRAILADAQIYDATVLIRGLYKDDFRTTLAKLKDLGIDGGIAIDPLLFRRFGVAAAPTYVLTLEPTSLKPTPHVKAAGAVSITYFLELVERTLPDPAKQHAQRHLLRGAAMTSHTREIQRRGAMEAPGTHQYQKIQKEKNDDNHKESIR